MFYENFNKNVSLRFKFPIMHYFFIWMSDFKPIKPSTFYFKIKLNLEFSSLNNTPEKYPRSNILLQIFSLYIYKSLGIHKFLFFIYNPDVSERASELF